MSSQLERLRGVGRNIGRFWQWITLASLLISLATTFLEAPALLTRPRGWAIIALSLAFASWYLWGLRWMLRGGASAFWRSGWGRCRLHPRGVALWAGMLALNIPLVLLSKSYVWILFAVYGVSLSVAPMPWAMLLAVPTALVLSAANGWLPHGASPQDLLALASLVLLFTIYTAVVYLPIMLLRGRAEREQMFAQLEQSHRELAAAHEQLAASAERDRELAVLRERARLARDMHDTLGHSLVLISVKLEAARRLRSVDSDRADREIAATQEVVRSSMAELRASLADLRSQVVALEPLGERLARSAREAGLRAGWHVRYAVSPDADIGRLDEATYEALLRVGSEALANAEHHARARSLELTLARDGGEVVLRVEDDGVGILATNPPRLAAIEVAAGHGAEHRIVHHEEQRADAPPEIDSPLGHYGITGMRERVTALGGRFGIGPADGARGTVVEARVPAAL